MVETYSKNWSGPAFTLGCYIDGERGIVADPNNATFQHEYGHYLQSQSVGWAYLNGYELPSVFGDPDNNAEFHNYNPIEQDANARAIEYFHNKLGNDLVWNFSVNPLGISSKNWNTISNYYDTPEFQSLLKNSIVKPKWYDYASWVPAFTLPSCPLTCMPIFLSELYHSLYYRKHNIYTQNE